MKTKINPILAIIIIAIGILILISLVVCLAMETVKSRRALADMAQAQQKIEETYAASVAGKTDASVLAKNGLRQLNINLPNFALISLKRATEVQKNYRDAWLALGLAQFKTNDVKGALASFQTAEKLDPIYAQTYEYLKITYERLEDMASAQKASDKYAFLTKK